MRRTLLVVVVLTFGCSRGDNGDVVATGTLEAVEVDVAPLAAARVVRVLVNEGDTVRAGQQLAELTQPTTQSTVEQSRAQVEASRAALSETQTGPRAAEIRRAQAELSAANAEVTRTSRDAERASTLARTGSIPLQQRDAAESAVRQAIARRDAARQTLLLLQQGSRPEKIAEARARVAGAEATLSGSVASAKDLNLTAPVDGVVLSRNAEPGEVLTPGEAAITLGETQRPWVRVYVNERDLPLIKVGGSVRGVLDGIPNRSFTGRVIAISTKAEYTPRVALTEEERADLMFGVKVEFVDSSGMLKPGLPITVTFARPTATTAPRK